jgi:membrane-associated protease RseP (regulator of RpoE activity)
MNCREFLIEFEERGALTEAATVHLNDCPGCKKTSSVQMRIWEMIDGFHRIDPPNDFDFRVKARIANARSSDFQTAGTFLPWLRYVLPVVVIGLLASVFALNALYFSNDRNLADSQPTSAVEKPSINNQVVASEQQQLQSFTDESITTDTPVVKTAATTERKQVNDLAVKEPVKVPEKLVKEKLKKVDAGSRDTTFSSATVINPLGVDPIKKNDFAAPNIDTTATMSIEDIGNFIGIEIVNENGKRRVKSITSNSLAERSGVRVGDVIDELNGKKLSDQPLQFKSLGAKSLTVIRASEKIEINLQN